MTAIDEDMLPDGREHAILIGDASGTARFTIGARYPMHKPGTYAVWIDEIRPATDRDRALAEARRLRSDAIDLRTAGKLDDAFQRMTRALGKSRAVSSSTRSVPMPRYRIRWLSQPGQVRGETACLSQRWQTSRVATAW